MADPKTAELGLAAHVSRPEVHDQLCRLWTKVLGGEYQPTSRESILLDIWLRTDGSGRLHDDIEGRQWADNQQLRDY